MNGIFLVVIGLSIGVLLLSCREHRKKQQKNLMSNMRFETIKELELKIPRPAAPRMRSRQRI